MDDEAAVDASAVLEALADLAPSAESSEPALAVPTDWFRWLPVDAVGVLAPTFGTGAEELRRQTADRAVNGEPVAVSIDRSFGERLAAVGQVRSERSSIRIGWLFVAGRTTNAAGQARRVFHPLVTLPVRVHRPPLVGAARLAAAGDVEVSELVADPEERLALQREVERRVAFGGGALTGISGIAVPPDLLGRLVRLQAFARRAAAAIGVPADHVVPAKDGPEQLMRADGVVVVAGAGVYVLKEAAGPSRAASLRAWGGTARTWTAFHSLYLPGGPEPVVAEQAEVESPYVLTPVQRLVVSRSRSEPVTLVSGAPGTGKSHTLAAVACDALARGERVLVAAKSDAAVDAVLDLFERGPGPAPVVFGANERRDALAARLSDGQVTPSPQDELEAAAERLASARATRDALRRQIVEALTAEQSLDRTDAESPAARTAAPRLFGGETDLGAVAAALRDATAPTTGWWRRRGQARARRTVSRLTGLPTATDPAEVSDLLKIALAAEAAAALRARGGLDLERSWPALTEAEAAARDALGHWLAVESRSSERLNRSTLPAVAALATALRSGRAASETSCGGSTTTA